MYRGDNPPAFANLKVIQDRKVLLDISFGQANYPNRNIFFVNGIPEMDETMDINPLMDISFLLTTDTTQLDETGWLLVALL